MCANLGIFFNYGHKFHAVNLDFQDVHDVIHW